MTNEHSKTDGRAWVQKLLTIAFLALTAHSASGEVTYLRDIPLPAETAPVLALTYAPLGTDPGYHAEFDKRVYLARAFPGGIAQFYGIDTATGALDPFYQQILPRLVKVDADSTMSLTQRGLELGLQISTYTALGQLVTYRFANPLILGLTPAIIEPAPFIDSLVEVFSMAAPSPDDAAKRKLSWSWVKGTADLADFGNPTTGTTNYRLCVYDGSELNIDAEVAAGRTCGSKPCWKSSDTGHTYKAKDGNDDGIAAVKLKAGVGKAAIQVKAGLFP